MNLRGKGALALWNGIDPARRAEYDLWHTREHVPERVAVPGMIGARRYVHVAGPLPEYLTLYDMADTHVLSSEAYLRLLNNPTPWSKSMRPSFRGFMRLCCRRELSIGGGLGAALGAAVLADGPALSSSAFLAAVRGLTSQPGIVAVHLLVREEAVPDVPFTIGGDAPDFPRGGALLLEGYDDDALAACFSAVEAALEALAGTASGLTSYRLACAVDRDSLEQLTPVKAPASVLHPETGTLSSRA
ncbi:hypothetical protein [Chelatococcus asaccharovorans]|uniref:hypothetical protein n=1 Tax=Chelatococcus asaccharovorans TaxID=28210 RepID=UPI00224C6BD1|nr:hypothetical protein [Chelatococcus asaccharovorans]CAH1672405.1 conserved hypothetical protein [Chelatococcus asaccharovorans]CAH1676181.1 conserved hypothetical protein [Chelatococcus asaccharovorans]